MNKGQLVDALESRLGSKKAAAEALEAVVDVITVTVAKGEKVAITGFGTFEKAARAARTGERIKAKKTAIPKFSAGADLKAVVSGAKKLPRLTLAKAATGARTATGTAKKAPAKKAPATTAAKKTTGTAKKTTAKKAPATKTAAKKATPAKKTAAKKTTAAKSTAKKATPAKKTTAKKATPAKKTTAKKTAKKA